MTEEGSSSLENELIETFLLALKKGMTAEEFFSTADATLEHLRGGVSNPVLEKVINGQATSEEVSRMIHDFGKTEAK
ncbi:MAG: hypothetical protein OEV92_13615 [Nitrospinota bacterium]|nr:hypothetical protein [Nitrospinota bacterium]